MARIKGDPSFWDRVHNQLRLTDNGCHEFTGHKDKCGYGRIRNGNKLVRIHREKWSFYNGKIKDGMCVCHKCDNPSCVNIDHLFIGSQKDNMRDRANKGRYDLRGEKNPSSKLKASDIIIIRNRIANSESCYKIARSYSVTGETILNIKNGRSWKDVV